VISSPRLGVAAVAVAAMLWGTIGTAQALLPEGREPTVVAALRLLIAASTLLLAVAADPASRRALRALPLSGIALAGSAIAVYNLLFFIAVLEAGVGIGTALAIGSAPVWLALYDGLWRHRRPEARQAVGQAICLAGAGLLLAAGATASANPLGLGLAILAGAAYATYSLSTSVIGTGRPASAVAAATFAVAAVLLLPALVVAPTAWVLQPTALAVLLLLGILSTGVAFGLYTWGLGYVPPGPAVTLTLLEPLTAWALATLVLGEPVTPLKAVGAVTLAIGLWWVASAPLRRR
jgi:DME family drug/metabolite transporter